MKITIYRSPDQDESGTDIDAGTTVANVTDPNYLVPNENTWVSSDGGTTYISDPEQGVSYDFCITIMNVGKSDSGGFKVKFLLSGDQDPALELETEEMDSLAPGDGVLAVVNYGAFENKFGIYHVQATVYTTDGSQAISTDQGFDFTINSD